ncbi:MAG: ABC transporter permease [Candidatus Hodarchaeales archaeon]|jgi:ABC-type lipoprotein release transport system permease subunit
MMSLAQRNSIKNLWRTGLLIAGIAFSVSMMMAASVLMDSANAAFRAHFEEKATEDLEIRPAGAETFSFTPQLEKMLAGSRFEASYLVLEKRLNVSAVFHGYFEPDWSQIKVVGFLGYGPEVGEVIYRLENPDQSANPLSPDNPNIAYDECIVDRDIQQWISIGPGSVFPPNVVLNLTTFPLIREVIWGGAIGFGTTTHPEGGRLIWRDDLWEAFFNIELLWDSWYPDTRNVSAIRLKLHDWTQVYNVKEELEETIDQDIFVHVLKEVGEEQIAGIHSYEDAVQAVVLIAAAVEFLFVFSQMIVIVFSERRAEIGQLRTFGATRLGILKMFIVESLIYGIIGSIIGAYGGLVGAAILTRIFGDHLVSTEVSLVINLGSVFTALLYGIAVTLAAGLLPAAYVAYQPPQLAIQSYGRSSTQLRTRHSLLFLGISLSLFFLGLNLLAQVRTTNLLDLNLFMDNALTIGLILLSAIFAEIILIRFLIPLFEKVWRQFPSFVRVLSARSILRSFRRNCAAMITAAVGISFVISASVFAASLEKTIPVFLEEASLSEIIMDAGEGNEQLANLAEEIRNKSQVRDVAYALGGKLNVSNQRINTIGVSADLISPSNALGTPKVVNGPSNAFQLLFQPAFENSSCVLSSSLADSLGVKVGDRIDGFMASNPNRTTLEILATVEPIIFLNNGDNIFANYKFVSNQTGLTGLARWFFVASFNAERTYRSLRSSYLSDFYRIIPVFRQNERLQETLEQQSLLFQVLLALVMVAGILAQGTAYLIGAIEREREMGIIRACGAEQRHISQIFALEGFYSSGVAIIVGLLNAALLLSLLFHLASKAMINVQIEIPLLLIVVWLIAAVASNYLASRIAFRRIKDVSPAQALLIPNQ